ncbi:MAG: carboxy-S-adenosyl-L-methionine synthase CmoA [Candidatus Thiodiazotropha sp.]
MTRDTLYADNQGVIGEFRFDERVARVFPDMINRSVPGYSTIINMIGTLAGQWVKPGSRVYDLGCSLGAASLAVRDSVPHHDYHLIAVDNSSAMLQQALRHFEELRHSVPVQWICADVRDIRVTQASLVILNFTLQFIPENDRWDFLSALHAGLESGGLLVLSEKIALSDPASQTLFTEMHHGFKKSQGYSELEISQKRTALENVLIPETLETHKQRLHEIGFQTVEVWFQCFNFVSLLAIK